MTRNEEAKKKAARKTIKDVGLIVLSIAVLTSIGVLGTHYYGVLTGMNMFLGTIAILVSICVVQIAYDLNLKAELKKEL